MTETLDTERDLTVQEELFIAALEVHPTTKAAAEAVGIPPEAGYTMVRRLKDVIQARTRDALTAASLRAAGTLVTSLDANGSTEKGELKVKAAESILDRSGITKHTNVDVQVEADNGLFFIPMKSEVPVEPEEHTET